MKEAYILQHITCQTCKMAVNVNPNVTETKEIMQAAASQLHAAHDGGIICPKPLLILIYAHCMVSNEVFKPAARLVMANGN